MSTELWNVTQCEHVHTINITTTSTSTYTLNMRVLTSLPITNCLCLFVDFWKPKGHVTYTNWYYKYVIDICMCSHLECSGVCTRRRPHTTEKFADAVAVSSTAVYCHIFQQGYTAHSILYRWMVYHSQAHLKPVETIVNIWTHFWLVIVPFCFVVRFRDMEAQQSTKLKTPSFCEHLPTTNPPY